MLIERFVLILPGSCKVSISEVLRKYLKKLYYYIPSPVKDSLFIRVTVNDFLSIHFIDVLNRLFSLSPVLKPTTFPLAKV